MEKPPKTPSKKEIFYNCPELFSGLTSEESAAMLGCSRSTIKNAMSESGHAIYLSNDRITYSNSYIEMLGVPSLKVLDAREKADVQARLDRLLKEPVSSTFVVGVRSYFNLIENSGKIQVEGRLA